MNKKYIDFVPITKVGVGPKKNSVVQRTVDSELRVIKKQKVGGAKVVRQTITEKKSEVVLEAEGLTAKPFNEEKIAQDRKKTEMRIPQVNFINQEKVVKRPLSKNVYAPKTEEKKELPEEKKEPVMIVENEKKSKGGTIIAIIVAIVLGAAAGTAVFFLLPK